MKLLLVGSDQVWSLERIFMKHLRETGVEAELFAAQNLLYEYNDRSILNKVLLRLGISSIYRSINHRLFEAVDRFRPTVIWVFKGMEVLPDSLRKLRSMGIKLANYNPDNPFVFTGRGSGNKNVTRGIDLYDLHFTYNLEIRRQLEARGLKTALLPFGFELEQSIYEALSGQPEIIRGCFIGNPDPQRAVIIRQLAEAGLAIDLYGNDWKKFVEHSNLTVYGPVYGKEFWRILRIYRVQLNLMRIHNPNSHNMRSFEVPGVGGIMLAPATPEHKLFFKDGEEAFLFTDIQDCLAKARYILGLPAEEAAKIRRRAREKSLAAGYSYHDRTLNVLQHLQHLHA